MLPPLTDGRIWLSGQVNFILQANPSFSSQYSGANRLGLYAGPDVEYIVNPGYNQARGPVFIGSFRLHVEL